MDEIREDAAGEGKLGPQEEVLDLVEDKVGRRSIRVMDLDQRATQITD